METQKYAININLYRETTSTKMKHSTLFVSVILLFLNEHYRKTNKVKKTQQSKTVPFHFERNINQLFDQ